MEIALVKYDEYFLKLSRVWLNDPEIKYLTQTPDFTEVQQIDWFKSLPERKDYHLWGAVVDSVPVGVFGLKNCSQSDCEYWGYIGERHYWGLGIGTKIMMLIEGKARELKKKSIWLQVIKENPRAIALYIKQNYTIERETESHLIMRKGL